MNAVTFQSLNQAIGGKFGVHDIACPLCSPDRRTAANRIRKVLRVWYPSPNFASYFCARCGEHGYVRDRDGIIVSASAIALIRAEQTDRTHKFAAIRSRKALTLWRSRQPIRGSIAERYLREVRAYSGPMPPTLGFLPPRGDYPPAMIAAFGIPDEIEPGVIDLSDAKVKGVHLTRLAPDGSDRDRGEKSKIMIGFSKGYPIVLAPPGDGLALIITEGIESGLSGFEATGLYTWAAGCASRLPALAAVIPTWVESVTILVDDDIDGRRHSASLAEACNGRGIELRFRVFGQVGSIAR